VALSWTEATDDSGRVAYRLRRNGTIIADTLTPLTYTDMRALPGTAYTYSVTAIDVALNESVVPATVNVTTPGEVATVGYLKAKIYHDLPGTVVFNSPGLPDLIQSAKWPNAYDAVRYVRGLTFGDPAFGDTFGDNYGLAIEGVLTLTAAEAGSYRFFTRSDDGSEFYLNTTGSSIPDPISFTSPTAVETGCCGPFEEPGQGANTAPPELVGTFPTSEPIALAAGQYGFLYLVKEGGGGDWGQLAWRREGDTTPANQLQPIPNILLSGVSDAVGTTVTILQDPMDVTVTENEATQLSFAAQVVTPHIGGAWYQWYRNDQPVFALRGAIRDTNAIVVSLPVAKAADGGVYKVRIGASGVDDIYTAEATLTVTADTKLPELVSAALSTSGLTTVTLRFSEPVTAPTATTAGNYVFSPAAPVTAAALSADGFTVTLTTALAEDTLYTLAINNVADNAGNAVAPGTSVQIQSWAILPRWASIQLWDGPGGAGLADMTNALNSASFPNSPNREFFRAGLTFGEEINFGNTYGDNYLAMMRAWITVPETGQYRFFIRSDDASKLFISTDESFPDPRTATAIAIESGCCGAFVEPGAADRPERTSAPISLTAGQRYGVTYVVKEGGGGDWGQVAMRREGDTTPAAELQPIREYASYYGPPRSPVTGGIAWVSFHESDARPTTDARNAGFTQAPDVGFTDLLEAKGYDVTRIFSTRDPDLDLLNQFDLVIISRSVPSVHYQNLAAWPKWNSLTAPAMVLGGYTLRPAQMGFTTGDTMVDTMGAVKLKVNDPTHPIFDGIALDGTGTMINDYAGVAMFNGLEQRGISVNSSPAAAGGTVLAVAPVGDPAVDGMVIAWSLDIIRIGLHRTLHRTLHRSVARSTKRQGCSPWTN
jgi:hypothetical protein